jgi:hypothetical protein
VRKEQSLSTIDHRSLPQCDRLQRIAMNSHRYMGYPGLAVTLLVAACASIPPPNEQLAASRAAIESAEVAGANKTAPVELAQARDKLSAAQLAVNNRDNDVARRLAEEALVDAQLAQAKASTARSREGLEQTDNAVRNLREEANRPTAPRPVEPASPTR